MADKTGIFNNCLAAMGEERITDPVQNDTRAVTLNDHYDDARDEVMALHPWNECMVRVGLPANGDTPAFSEFTSVFDLPTDPYCLRVWRTEEPKAKYRRLGRTLQSSEAAPFKIEYIGRILDEGKWGPLLANAVAMRLGVKTGLKITQDPDMPEIMEKKFIKAMSEARMADGQEGTPEQTDESDFLDARL